MECGGLLTSDWFGSSAAIHPEEIIGDWAGDDPAEEQREQVVPRQAGLQLEVEGRQEYQQEKAEDECGTMGKRRGCISSSKIDLLK